MTPSLRPFARSPRLRALGVLAWLMLVVHALAAVPPQGMPGSDHRHAARAGVAAVAGQGHRLAATCCDGTAGGHAAGFDGHGDCAAMCGNALVPSPPAVPVAMVVGAPHEHPLRIAAPSMNPVPPLRPPLA